MSVALLRARLGAFRIPARVRWRGSGRRLAIALATALAGAVVLAVALLTVFSQFGWYGTYVVLSDSMQPAIRMGSIVVVAQADPATLRPGDIISYTSAAPPHPTLTHRIVRISRDGDGRLTFKTKGDYNVVEDPWDVHYSAKAGLVVAAIPLAGFAVAGMTTPIGRAAFGLLLVAVVLLFWLRSVWARPSLPPLVIARREPAKMPAGHISPRRVAMLLWLAVELLAGRRMRLP